MAKGFIRKCKKGLRLLRKPRFRKSMWKGVAAAIEHKACLSRFDPQTVVDIGANKGQFSLLALEIFSSSRVYSFEPLSAPRNLFLRVLGDDERVHVFPAAIGPEEASLPMNISASDDSSSFLPITEQQVQFFPGTEAVGIETVRVAPLDCFLSEDEIVRPALLKIDVQGFECEVLKGCENMLPLFDVVYVECSFVELYAGQALASEVFKFLIDRGYRFAGVYNLSYSSEGMAIQGDFLFQR